MRKPLPPSQSEVEAAQRDLFKRGDIKAVAAQLDVSDSYVGKLLDPDDPEHRSPFYTIVRWMFACDMQEERLGDGHIILLNRLRSRWLDRQGNGIIPMEVPTSMFAFLQAQIAELPYDEQMQFLDQTYLEIGKHKQRKAELKLEDNVQSIKRK